MKRLVSFFLALAATASVPATGGIPAESLGTVSYDVRYKLGAITTKVATATISWEEASWNGTPAYHSAALVRTTPIFRLFISSDYVAETYFTRSDLTPLYFVNPFKRNKQDGKFEYVYQNGHGEIASTTVRGDDEPEYKTFPNDGTTLDLLSLLHFVRFVPLSDDSEPLEMHILMAGKSYPALLEYLGTDDDKIPGIPAEKLHLRMTEHGLMENKSGNELYLWRATTPDHRLLCLETNLSSGRMICAIQQ